MEHLNRIQKNLNKLVLYVGDKILLKDRDTCKIGVKKSDDKIDTITDSDLSSDAHIRLELSRLVKEGEFPECNVISEEIERYLTHSSRTVIYDPNDGTDAYAKKLKITNPERLLHKEGSHILKVKPIDLNKYAVFMTYVKEGVPQAGAVYIPHFKELIWGNIKEGKAYYKQGNNRKKVLSNNPKKLSLDSALIGLGTMSNKYTDRYKSNEQYGPLIEAMHAILKDKKVRFAGSSAIYDSSATCFPKNHGEKIDLAEFSQVLIWDLPTFLCPLTGNKAYTVMRKNNGFEIKEHDYKSFEYLNPDSDLFNKSCCQFMGNPFVAEQYAELLEKRLR